VFRFGAETTPLPDGAQPELNALLHTDPPTTKADLMRTKPTPWHHRMHYPCHVRTPGLLFEIMNHPNAQNLQRFPSPQADNLADLEDATRRALQWQLDNNYISDLEVVVTNPVGYSRDVKIVQYQPDGSSTTIKFWMDQNGAVNVNI
jgi:hypothetical protein